MMDYDLKNHKTNDLDIPNVWRCLQSESFKTDTENIRAIKGLEYQLKQIPVLFLAEMENNDLSGDFSKLIKCVDSTLNKRSDDVTQFLSNCTNLDEANENQVAEYSLAKKIYLSMPNSQMTTIAPTNQLRLHDHHTHDYRYVASNVYIAYVHCTEEEIQKSEEQLIKLKDELGSKYRFATYENYKFLD
ncbi:unnamed protein product, partial [Didymodactylos carnosus]